MTALPLTFEQVEENNLRKNEISIANSRNEGIRRFYTDIKEIKENGYVIDRTESSGILNDYSKGD